MHGHVLIQHEASFPKLFAVSSVYLAGCVSKKEITIMSGLRSITDCLGFSLGYEYITIS